MDKLNAKTYVEILYWISSMENTYETYIFHHINWLEYMKLWFFTATYFDGFYFWFIFYIEMEKNHAFRGDNLLFSNEY